MPPLETQHTSAPHGHLLTNYGVWSPDSRWIVYDVRSDPAGSVFDGTSIQRVHVETGEVQVLYRATRGAGCGVVTCSPIDERVVFIHGPEEPSPDWQYSPCHRRGVVVDARCPDVATNLDACDLTPPLTAGALRGGSHVHTFSGDGRWVSFTYEDHVLTALGNDVFGPHDVNQRNVGISVPLGAVEVAGDHPRNHSGSHFSVLATRTVNQPRPGSDEIGKAFEESWIGTNGYVRGDGSRQQRAIAFQGQVVTSTGENISEVFVVDLPEDVTIPSDDGPLAGTATQRPRPPRGATQRRLTYTAERRYPGLQGPRHWLRSSPDGSQIAFLMKDDDGVVQLWTISPSGGEPRQITRQEHPIASAFTWSPQGDTIAHVLDNCVCITELASGQSRCLTARSADADAPRPEACVFSPDGLRVAYVRNVLNQGERWNQICSVPLQ